MPVERRTTTNDWQIVSLEASGWTRIGQTPSGEVHFEREMSGVTLAQHIVSQSTEFTYAQSRVLRQALAALQSGA
ncbi:MAG: hypothetical protein NXI17_05910 [Alphaproteobacteria bacterium]|nr:hypothetical protein [Alphaproteobacteria bacterium]